MKTEELDDDFAIDLYLRIPHYFAELGFSEIMKDYVLMLTMGGEMA